MCIESKSDFNACENDFRQMIGEEVYVHNLDLVLDKNKEANDVYEKMWRYAKQKKFNLKRRLLSHGVLKKSWWSSGYYRPDDNALMRWAKDIEHLSPEELRAENPECEFVEFTEEVMDGPGGKDLDAFDMVRPGDAIQMTDGGFRVKFFGHQLGCLYSVKKENYFDLVKYARLSGIVHGRIYAEMETVDKIQSVRLYYCVDKRKSRVKDGVLYSEDGRTVMRCVEDLKSIAIPEGVVEIADGAFRNCPLTSVSLPSTLLRIGKKSFAGTEITRIVLPQSIEAIGEQAFSYSANHDRNSDWSMPTKTTYYEVEPGNKRFFSKNGSLFERLDEGVSLRSLHFYPAGIMRLRVPEGVTYLDDASILNLWGRFSNASEVLLPDSVKVVDASACDSYLIMKDPATYARVLHDVAQEPSAQLVERLQKGLSIEVGLLDELSAYERETIQSLEPGEEVKLLPTVEGSCLGRPILPEYDETIGSLSVFVDGMLCIGKVWLGDVFGIDSMALVQLQMLLSRIECEVEAAGESSDQNEDKPSFYLRVNVRPVEAGSMGGSDVA